MTSQNNFSESVHFRAITPDDYGLLRAIYDDTRAHEMALVPHWSDEQKEAFLDQQFNAQHTYYQQVFSTADYMIVMLGDQPAGRLYLDRRRIEFRIIDISLLPAFRNQGLGSFLLKQVITEASEAGKPVTIHVEHNNPALRLYERLGFVIKEEVNGVYWLMERNPGP
jgi:ribosomal protein S18 acetylase RimI-like enzyme